MNRISIRVAGVKLVPITPMRLKKIKSPEELLNDYKPEELLVQQKIDGWKCMAIKTNNIVKLYTRRGIEFTKNVPQIADELKNIPNNSFILGELAWIGKDDKQSIGDLQTIVGSNPDKVKEHGNGQIVFYVYDLLWKSGNDITKRPYIERYNSLKSLIGDKEQIKLVKNYAWDKKDQAIKDALKSGGEGIVIKSKQSTYHYGQLGESEKTGEWYKFKPEAKAQSDEVILKEYESGKEKLIFPAYQYKNGQLFEVGKLSGMGKEEETKLKDLIDSNKHVVVEVSFQERMESGKFRHLSFVRIREDKPAKEVKYAMKRISHRIIASEGILTVFHKHPEIEKDVESMCMHSGGHKSLHSILHYLREKLGPDIISYSDADLIKFIKQKKEQFGSCPNSHQHFEAGEIGTDPADSYEDLSADYYNHGR